MNVKNIIKIACDFVDYLDLKENIDSTLTANQETEKNELLKYLNWVHEEVSTEYFPLLKKESINSESFLPFSDLENEVAFVKSVSFDMAKKDFDCFPDGIRFDGFIDEIVYAYIPQNLELLDNFQSFVTERVYAYGIAREFFLQRGISDKAVMFNSRFFDSVKNFVRTNQSANKTIPARKWL